MSRRELAVAAVALVAFGGVVLAGHVVLGSFYDGDWRLAAGVRFDGFSSTAHGILSTGHRPLQAIYLPLVVWVTGEHAHAALTLVALAHVAMCGALYVFLRTLGFELLHAAAITLLAFVFPFADSNWMYVTGSTGTVAVTLWLLGATVALYGLREPGRRSGVLHGVAVALYVASVLTYELALAAVLASVALYAGRAPRALVLRRWAIDVAAMVPVLLVETRAVGVLPGHDTTPTSSLFSQLGHLITGGGTVIGSSLEPFGAPPRVVVLVLAVAVVVTGLAVRVRDRSADPQLRRWLAIAGASSAGVIVAWLVLLPFDERVTAPGVGNGINAFAGLWICVMVYAVAMLLAALATHRLRPRRWTPYLGSAIAVVVAAGYVHRADSDKSNWALASLYQHRELVAIGRGRPHRTRVRAAPGIPVFGSTAELAAAVRLTYGRAR
jgi:hypothetical protein